MEKRERLERTLAGEPTDRVPVALWRHWPGDDQRSADLTQATLDFQKAWDFDFVVVMPADSYSVLDYGVQDSWVGNLEGKREYTRRAVVRSLDWTDLRRLEPTRGSLGTHLIAVKQVQEALGDETAVLHTIYSPMSQAEKITGPENLIQHLRREPERLKTGLNIITDNTLRYIDAMRKFSIAGILYVMHYASYNLLSEAEYREFGQPYDMRLLQTLPQTWWFNMVNLHGAAPMFDVVAQYPVQAINWHDRETVPDLARGKLDFKGAVCGGLGRWDTMHNGTPGAVREQIVNAMNQTNRRRFILSAGSNIITTTPISNIRTVRQSVEA